MCGDYNLRREKRYVEVDVRFTPDGKIRPLAINYSRHNSALAGGFVRFADTSSTKKPRAVQALSA